MVGLCFLVLIFPVVSSAVLACPLFLFPGDVFNSLLTFISAGYLVEAVFAFVAFDGCCFPEFLVTLGTLPLRGRGRVLLYSTCHAFPIINSAYLQLIDVASSVFRAVRCIVE